MSDSSIINNSAAALGIDSIEIGNDKALTVHRRLDTDTSKASEKSEQFTRELANVDKTAKNRKQPLSKPTSAADQLGLNSYKVTPKTTTAVTVSPDEGGEPVIRETVSPNPFFWQRVEKPYTQQAIDEWSDQSWLAYDPPPGYMPPSRYTANTAMADIQSNGFERKTEMIVSGGDDSASASPDESDNDSPPVTITMKFKTTEFRGYHRTTIAEPFPITTRLADGYARSMIGTLGLPEEMAINFPVVQPQQQNSQHTVNTGLMLKPNLAGPYVNWTYRPVNPLSFNFGVEHLVGLSSDSSKERSSTKFTGGISHQLSPTVSLAANIKYEMQPKPDNAGLDKLELIVGPNVTIGNTALSIGAKYFDESPHDDSLSTSGVALVAAASIPVGKTTTLTPEVELGSNITKVSLGVTKTGPRGTGIDLVIRLEQKPDETRSGILGRIRFG